LFLPVAQARFIFRKALFGELLRTLPPDLRLHLGFHEGNQFGGALTASLTPAIASRFGRTTSFCVAAGLWALGAAAWLLVDPNALWRPNEIVAINRKELNPIKQTQAAQPNGQINRPSDYLSCLPGGASVASFPRITVTEALGSV